MTHSLTLYGLLFLCYFHIQVTAPIDVIIKQKADPAPRLVFLEGVSDNNPKSAIVIAENQVLCSVKPENDGHEVIAYSILVLLSVFYVFDVKYPQRHINMFTFFEEKLMNKKFERPSHSYERFIQSLNKE